MSLNSRSVTRDQWVAYFVDILALAFIATAIVGVLLFIKSVNDMCQFKDASGNHAISAIPATAPLGLPRNGFDIKPTVSVQFTSDHPFTIELDRREHAVGSVEEGGKITYVVIAYINLQTLWEVKSPSGSTVNIKPLEVWSCPAQ